MAAIETKFCFISGAAIFLVNTVVMGGIPPLAILTAIVLPGFIFGFVLLNNKQSISIIKKSCFLLVSGGLYMAAAFLIVGHSVSWQNEPYAFSIASVGGAVGLLLAYNILLDKSVSLTKGIPMAIGVGLLAALLPTAAMFNVFGISSFDIIGVTSVFVIWQTLFGWTLNKARASDYIGTTSTSS